MTGTLSAPTGAGAELRLRRDLHHLDGISRAAMTAVLHPVLPATADALATALPVAPRHRALLDRWLTALTAAGALRRDAHGVFHPTGPADTPALHELPSRYERLGFPPEMARLHRAALERLPDLLADRVALTDLLPEDTDVVASLGAYQRNAFTGRLHARCAELVAEAVARQAPGRVRVVELGGGSGVTTEALRGLDTDHTFTDVSPLYTAAAAERFGVATALLDVDADFTAQGFPAGGADVVVAANVLHNATDIPAALRRVRRLLAPGGTLLLVDSAGDCDTVLTSMQFLLSPPASSPHAADPHGRFTDRRAGTATVFPAAGEWEEDLTAAGFDVRARHPDDTAGPAPAGQYLWHAAVPGAAAVDTAELRRLLDGRDGEPVCTADGTDLDAAAVLAAVAGDRPGGSGSPLPDEAARFCADLAQALTAVRPRPAPDPGPPPHVLVLTGDPAGAQAALDAWARRGRVTAVPPDTAPARLLAALERAEATEAVLPLALARALPATPAAGLTDLSALTRVSCPEPGVTAADVTAWAELGPRLERAPGLAATAPRTRVDSPAVAADAAPRGLYAAARADLALRGLDVPACVDAAHEVARAALLSMLHTLHRAGCLTGPGTHTPEEIAAAVRPAPEHRRLLDRWLTVLTEEHLLDRSPSGALTPTVPPDTYTDLDTVWRPALRGWRAAHGSDATVAYARRSAGELLALMRAERSAAALLFPRGETDTARSLYRESATARYQHHAAAALVADQLRATPRGRVLEAGGGTATTTEVVLPELERLPGTSVEYLFTDVSPFFLDHARARFGDRLRYGLLDVDRDPGEQGHAAGSFDAVVAGGVLNAAVDTDASVRGLARLLVPGGLLVLTEPTREEYWVLASQGFLLAAPRDARADSGASFLTHTQWRAVLDGAGLLPVADLPAEGHPLHPLGHRVFAARRP
ncbi:2-methoxy-6-polyprenyl-1,4-benzoquinol methylase, mitochondrial [Streptomyces sp. enrichment culture]|uniref:methyltransferase n=1 Tax=Streptomyces sp. enrichment culture TaxID=1795815 RepID=UPI003F56409C